MKLVQETHQQVSRHFDIDMYNQSGRNNNETGKNRRDTTIKICARFNIIDPTIIQWLYNISKPLALEHLNKLVQKDNLLTCVKTIRSVSGRVYVLNYNGAKYAEHLLGLPVYFRSKSDPTRLVNQNNIMHDLINIFVCLRGLQEFTDGAHTPLWRGMLSEPEFKRIYKSSTIRNVDGLLEECNENRTIVAVEIENSFKNKQTRRTILLKYLDSLKGGYYEKVFFFSQSKDILIDARRLNRQLVDELSVTYDKKNHKPFLSEGDADLLKRSIIYRTKFCEEIKTLFYP